MTAAEPPSRNERMLAWPEVRRLTGISRTTVWREVNAGRFPPPVAISARRVAWRSGDIEAWLAGKRDWAKPAAGP